jgi:hypothetical protein
MCFSPITGLSSGNFHDTYGLLCSHVKPFINMVRVAEIVKRECWKEVKIIDRNPFAKIDQFRYG